MADETGADVIRSIARKYEPLKASALSHEEWLQYDAAQREEERVALLTAMQRIIDE